MNRNAAVVGLQWGDEGKGKIVDILASRFDCVARYQGGHNAGHTVNIDGHRHVLHLIPSGIFHDKVTCVVGGGVVIDPPAFLKEVEGIGALGVRVDGRLFVSNRAHVIFPYHRVFESAMENHLGESKLGTTSRGIGPSYEDKMGRRGIRVADLLNSSSLPAKIKAQVDFKNGQLAGLGCPERVNAEEFCAAYLEYAEKLRPFVRDTTMLLNHMIREGKAILFEGAQATLLDIDHGTFPFVTSSSASTGGVAAGLGISPKHVHRVVGITKAYTTRVGTGPFPTGAGRTDEELIRSRGGEFGATTGRERRCGWFDGPAGRYSTMINGLDQLVVTKIDVLDSFSEIPFCTDYRYKGSILKEFPAEIEVLANVEPVYTRRPGWSSSTAGIREWKKLPLKAQDYLKFLSDYLAVPIGMVSTGPGRDETIHVEELS